MKELVYEPQIQELFHLLKDEYVCSFATSYKDKVTTRTMYGVFTESCGYFLTRKSSVKFKQLSKNSHIGISCNNIQIEGKATVLGHPKDEKNEEIVHYCLSHGYDQFQSYMKYKNTVLIKVSYQTVKIWTTTGSIIIDLIDQKAFSKK